MDDLDHLIARVHTLRRVLAAVHEDATELHQAIPYDKRDRARARMNTVRMDLNEAMSRADAVLADLDLRQAVKALPADASEDDYHATVAKVSGRA